MERYAGKSQVRASALVRTVPTHTFVLLLAILLLTTAGRTVASDSDSEASSSIPGSSPQPSTSIPLTTEPHDAGQTTASHHGGGQTTAHHGGGETTESHSSVQTTTPHGGGQQVVPLDTHCGENVPLPVGIDVKLSVYSVNVDYENASISHLTPTNGNTLETDFVTSSPGQDAGSGNSSSFYIRCSWVIPVAANSSEREGNLVVLSDPQFCKEGGVFTFYDLNPANGSRSLIGDPCVTHAATMLAGRQGYKTLVVFRSKGMTREEAEDLVSSNGTSMLFLYSAYSVPDSQCPPLGSEGAPLIANTSEVTTSWGSFMPQRLPNGLSCYWKINTEGEGVLNLRVFSFIWGSPNGRPKCSANDTDDFILLLDLGSEPPHPRRPLKVPICDDGTWFEHRTLSGQMALIFKSGPSGGAPLFTLTYKADDMQHLCPMHTNPSRIEAKIGEVGIFKGVNRAQGDPSGRECKWRLLAPFSGHNVIKVFQLDNQDYLSVTGQDGDRLSLNSVSAPVGKLFDEDFPIWSSSQEFQVEFHVAQGTQQRQFLLYYTAVPRGQCQGQATSLTATKVAKTWAQPGLPGNSPLSPTSPIGTDCRWLIMAESSVHKVQVNVTFPYNGTIDFSCPFFPWLSASYPGSPSDSYVPCYSTLANSTTTTSTTSNNKYGQILTLSFVGSEGREVMIKFNRAPEVLKGAVEQLEMRVVSLPGPGHTGGASKPLGGSLFPPLLLMLCVMVASFNSS